MTQHKNSMFFKVTIVSALMLFFQVWGTAADGLLKSPFVKDKKINAEITYILDGDSFVAEIEGREYGIRLWGIDCPEYNQPGGEEAKAFLDMLVKKKSILVTPKDIDKYGRLVAIAENRDGVLNEQLVISGHAWVYTYFCREPVCEKWKRLEKRAREKRLGVWKNDHPAAPWMWKKKK